MGDPQVTVEQGTLKGILGNDLNGRKYYSFFGIPYAKAPLGKLRFKAPQPPEKWSGIRSATTDIGACYSRDMVQPTVLEGVEDCLVLNVYTPELPKTTTSPKPVMVWIHGGGFVSGSNDSKMYGPQFLITEDVVIVAVNYRLGVLGFLSIDDPKVGVPGNAGLKDMVMALKWVQGNIKHFDGDPNNVTIFGESAGGISVHLLILSPLTTGLFHKAIILSGSALMSTTITMPSAKKLAKALNCPATQDSDILTFLQSLSIEEIFKGQEAIIEPFEINQIRSVGPVIEKVTPNEPAFLSEHPVDIIKKGNYNKVPMITGYTDMEGLLFYMFNKWSGQPVIPDFEKMILPSFKLKRGSDSSKAVANKIKMYYYGIETPNENNMIKQYKIFTDAYFIYPIQRGIKHHVVSSNQPIYLYRFAMEGVLNFTKVVGKIDLPGTAHGDELGYLFRTYITPDNLHLDSKEMKMVRRMVKLWTNFAKTGNSNQVEDIVWEPVTQNKLNCLDIGENLTIIVNPERERMEFWDNVSK